MKKVWIGFIVVFVLMVILGYIIDTLILGSTYESLTNIWRPDMQSKIWIFYLVMLFQAFFFSFIFSKGYEGKGIAEGVRYGLYIGIWMSVGMAYGSYAMIPIPYSLALQWFIYGVIQYIIYGIALALVFRKKAPPPATT
jgi:hypothetical protein